MGILASLLLIAGVWYGFLSSNLGLNQDNPQLVVETPSKPETENNPEKAPEERLNYSGVDVDVDEGENANSKLGEGVSEEVVGVDNSNSRDVTDSSSSSAQGIDLDSTNVVIEGDKQVADVQQSISIEPEVQPVPVIQPAPVKQTISNPDSQFNQLLSAEQANTSRIQAFRNLSDIWDMPLPSLLIDDFCTEVRKLELDCYVGKSSSLQELVLYNRPAILVLENLTGVHRVILRGVNETDANVQIGDTQITVTRNELEELWNGNYLLYWQPPAVGYRLFQQGNSGDQVVWLRQQINFALLKNQQTGLDDTVSSVYDEQLSQAVRNIQTSAGIPADGQVGLQTYMIINQMLNARTIPKLDMFDANLNAGVSPSDVNATIIDPSAESVNQESDEKAL